jgi:thiol-disulfide isomerase/thioredoxin
MEDEEHLKDEDENEDENEYSNGYEDEDIELEKESRSKVKSKSISSPIYDSEPKFKFRQFLSLIIIIGFIVIGTAAGSYGTLRDLMEAPCLGCLGLYPNIELDFTFETLDDKDHPDWILDELEDGPVFIEFTQNDENCPPCKRMRPYVHDLNEEYNDEVVFFIININEHEIARSFEGETEVESSYNQEPIYHVYDIGLIAGGVIATPTYIIITLNDDFGTVKPYFAVGYGEFTEEDAEKTAESLAEALDYAKTMHHHYLETYLKTR